MKLFYKTILLLFLICPLLILNSFSQQAPGIQWQNSIGGSWSDDLYSVQATFDGGYILGGMSDSPISGDKTDSCIGYVDYWIVKLDSYGTIQWQKTIGGTGNDWIYSICQTTDNGYILGGYSISDSSGNKNENCLGEYDYWVLKLDSSGNILWQNTIGGSLTDVLYCIQQTSDNGYILGGYSGSNVSGDKTEYCIGATDYWVIKLDSSGNIQWQNTIGGNDYDALYSIQQTFDGGYILGGSSKSDSIGDKTENDLGSWDYWIVKIDTNGNIQWQNTIGGNGDDYLYSVQQTSDKGYILGGWSNSNISGDKTENTLGGYDYWIIKIDSIGNLQWQNTIGGNHSDYLFDIKQTINHDYIACGSSLSGISSDKTEICKGGSDYWVIKLDSTGNLEWQKTIGGNYNDNSFSICQTPDGGYFLGGWSLSGISGDKTENSFGSEDFWVVKLLPDTITSIPDLQSSINNLQLFPNPSSGIFQITFPSSSNQKPNYTLEVINTLGQTVYESAIKQTDPDMHRDDVHLDVSFLPKGIYVLRLSNRTISMNKTLVID